MHTLSWVQLRPGGSGEQSTEFPFPLATVPFGAHHALCRGGPPGRWAVGIHRNQANEEHPPKELCMHSSLRGAF